MASVSAVSMVMTVTQNKPAAAASSFFKPLLLKPSTAAVRPSSAGVRKFQVSASSLKMEKALSGLTAAALTASMMIPEVAEAAGSGVSPSLKNFLLSIAAGGVVLVGIIGVVIGVSNFDPVKRE